MARHSARILGILAAGIMVFILCAPAAGQKWGEITDSEKVMGPPAQFPEAPAIVLFDIGYLEFKIEAYAGHMIMDRHVRIKVFKKDAAEDAIDVDIPCVDEDDLKKLEAETIAPDGTRIPVKNFYDKRTRHYKIRTFTFPAVVDGAILEYHYNVHLNSSVPTWVFHSALFTKRSQFSIAAPLDFPFTVNRRNFRVEPKKTSCTVGFVNGIMSTYEATDLEPAKDEPLMRARDESVASISLMYKEEDAQFWPKVGRRLSNALNSYTRNQKVLKSVADSLCANLTTSDEKIRCLFRYVHDDIKDATPSDKIRDAADVLRKKRANDDDRNVILTALLNSQNISAHVLFIGTRDEHGEFNPALHKVSQLNRWLCYVDKDSSHVALDAADEYALYPFVPRYDLVGGGLLIDGDNSHTIRYPQPARKNGTDVIATFWVRSDGSAACTTAVDVHGYDLENYHEFFADTISSEAIVKRILEGTGMTYKIIGATKTMDRDADDMKFDIILDLPKFATVLDSSMFLTPFVIPIDKNYFTSDRRFFPVDFFYTFVKRHRIRIYLPDGMSVSDLPLEIRGNIDGASFSRKILAEGNIIDARIDFKIERPYFTVAEYPDLKKLYDVLASSRADKIAVSQQDAK